MLDKIIRLAAAGVGLAVIIGVVVASIGDKSPQESSLQAQTTSTPPKLFAGARTEELRTEPRADAPRIVNAKATEALGKTHYKLIDNSTTAREIRQQDGWSEVQITEPSWLASDRGWVRTAALRDISRTNDGKRVFVESDIFWDSKSSPWKAIMVAGVNKVSSEIADCMTLDPGTASVSSSRGTPSKPVFFVTCNGARNMPFNVWFTADGIIQR